MEAASKKQRRGNGNYARDCILSPRAAFPKDEPVYKFLLEHTKEIILILSRSGKIIFVNKSILPEFGYYREELIGKSISSLLTKRSLRKAFAALAQEFLGRPQPDMEVQAKTKYGEIRYLSVAPGSAPIRENGKLKGVMISIDDITDHKKAQEALRYRLEMEKLISVLSTRFISLTPADVDGAINDALSAIGAFAGVDRSYVFQFFGGRTAMNNTHEWCARGIEPQKDNLQGLSVQAFPWWMDKLFRFETILIPRVADLPSEAGTEKDILRSQNIQSLLVVPLVYGGSLLGFLGFDSVRKEKTWAEEDIALLKILGEILANALERKRAEEALQASERKYRTLFEYANDAVFLLNSEGRHVMANKMAADMLGYTQEELLGLSCEDVVASSEKEKARDKLRGILEGKSFPLYERIFRKKDGTEFPAEINLALIRDKKGHPLYIQSIVRDITRRKQTEKERHQIFLKVRESLDSIIHVVAATVELRDPYTAGHQRRVADIAQAIAAEMGLSKDRVDGICMAGVIHDIGKISVPAEILSKPGRLNEHELRIIRCHPQVGYDILKKVEFPWPIAQIVYQHHEKMNGSGYPQGLAGPEILLEARILAVADTVEAMASHRPYRPAQGIEKALEVVSQNRGTLYDPDVVDACLKIFREKRYDLK